MDKFNVYSLTQSLPAHKGCIIVRDGDLVLAIYTKVFGPAPERECFEWKLQNCTETTLQDLFAE